MKRAVASPNGKFVHPCSPPLRSDAILSTPLQLTVLGGALVVAFVLYWPALRAPFIFDDVGLPFARIYPDQPLSAWISGVRPFLMFTYWLNRTLWGDAPLSYHAANVVIHALNTLLVFLILCRLLPCAGWTRLQVLRAALAGSFVFLVHPVQTESVSYVAGRSESLASLFMLLAYAAFLYRRQAAISWRESIAVLALFAVAVKTKENAVSLAGILVLTDMFWPVPYSLSGLRRNWKLYIVMAPGAIVAAIFVFRMLATADSAGFSIPDSTWYQYGFTQARAIFAYVGLVLWPAGLSVDHSFAVSHTVWEHGAIFWLILLAAVIAACIRWARRCPLACFGTLLFLVALAPTSSIVHIADPLVDRRMYLPLLGLILVGCEVSRHVHLRSHTVWGLGTLAAMLLVGFCYSRNQQWGRPEVLMADAAARSTVNWRPYVNLAEILIHENRCAEAIPYLQRADRLFPHTYYIEVSWGWTLECTKDYERALGRLQRAARLIPNSRVYESIGLLYGEMGRSDEAGLALQKAVDLNPRAGSAHAALGLWYESVRNYDAAQREYTTSVSLDPHDNAARYALIRVQQAEASAGR